MHRELHLQNFIALREDTRVKEAHAPSGNKARVVISGGR